MGRPFGTASPPAGAGSDIEPDLYCFEGSNPRCVIALFGGEGGIRTLEGVATLLVFKTSAFNHSATSPAGELSTLRMPARKRGATDTASPCL